MLRNLFKTLIALLCLTLPLRAAIDKRTVITLHGSTVADIICSERNGHVGFKIPLAPQFSKQRLNTYPALYRATSGTLTTGAMVRFIKHGYNLFDSVEKQRQYTACLNECIAAHKAWLEKKSESNLATLHALEDAVFCKLQELNLADQEIRQTLEAILSTPEEKILSKAYNFIAKLNNPWACHQENDVITMKRMGNLKTAAKICGTFLATYFIVIIPIVGIFARDGFSAFFSSPSAFKAWQEMHPKIVKFDNCINTPLCTLLCLSTLFKAPELGNGIKVVIKPYEQKR